MSFLFQEKVTRKKSKMCWQKSKKLIRNWHNSAGWCIALRFYEVLLDTSGFNVKNAFVEPPGGYHYLNAHIEMNTGSSFWLQ